MQTDSPIHSNHKHSHIVADTHSGTYSQLLVELIKLECLERGEISILHPYITGIQEQGTIKIAPDLRTVFQIRLELDISRTKDVGILVTQGTVVLLAWSDTSHTEGTDTVGSTYIEHLRIRCLTRIAVTPDHSGIQVSHQGGCFIQLPILHEICFQLEELRILVLEHRLTLVVPFSAAQKIAQRQNIAGFAHRS